MKGLYSTDGRRASGYWREDGSWKAIMAVLARTNLVGQRWMIVRRETHTNEAQALAACRRWAEEETNESCQAEVPVLRREGGDLRSRAARFSARRHDRSQQRQVPHRGGATVPVAPATAGLTWPESIAVTAILLALSLLWSWTFWTLMAVSVASGLIIGGVRSELYAREERDRPS